MDFPQYKGNNVKDNCRNTVLKPSYIDKNGVRQWIPVQKKNNVKEKSWLPDAFGYSIELNGNLNLGGILGLNGKAGVNYVVFTNGPFAWFPYEYGYLGYSIETIIKFNLKEQIEALEKLATKPLKSLKTGISANVGFSPFLAWMKNNGDSKMIIPKSWEEWFSANTMNVQIKDGLGFSFGGSVFVSATTGWEPNKPLDWNNLKPGEWKGATVDLGIGVGTPGINMGTEWAAYYWLWDQAKAHNRTEYAFWKRWYNFFTYSPDVSMFLKKILHYFGVDFSFVFQKAKKEVEQHEKLFPSEESPVIYV